MQQNKGFTLIEVIFTLSIIIILSTLTFGFVNTKPKASIQEVKTALTWYIEEAKNYSLLHHKKVNLEFDKTHLSYKLGEEYYCYHLPENYYFDHIEEVYFNHNGNINQANHINIVGYNQIYQLVFHLGAGDFYIQ